jgi:chromosome segregation ATPase
MADIDVEKSKNLEMRLAENRDRAIELERKLKERDMELKDRDERLSTKDRHIEGLNKMISRIAVLEAELTKKEGLLSELERRITSKEGQISELERKATVYEGRITALGRDAADANLKFGDCKAELLKRDARIKTLERETADNKEKINAILNSASWRISAPLRFAAGILGKKK